MALRLSRRMELSVLILMVTGLVLLTPPVRNSLKDAWKWARQTETSVKMSPKPPSTPPKGKIVAQSLAELNSNLAKGNSDANPPPSALPSAPSGTTPTQALTPLPSAVNVKETKVLIPTPPASQAEVVPPKAVTATATVKKALALKPKSLKVVVTRHVPRVRSRVIHSTRLPSVQGTSQNAGIPAPAGITASEATVPFTWTPSTDITCDPRAGCNLVWVLEKAPWPKNVKDELMKNVRDVSPTTIFIGPDWQGWLVRRTHTHVFEPDAVARFGNLTIDALHWYAESEGTGYHLIRVSCLTWAGFTSAPRAPSKRAVASELGVIPIAFCP